jgi:hypothetical protein
MTDSDGPRLGLASAAGDTSTRRGLLGWTARLALAGPALLAGFQVAQATAHADDDDNEDQGNEGPGRGRGRGLGRQDNRGIGRDNATFSADLVPVNEVNTSDFNPGQTDTGFGSLVVGAGGMSSGPVSVALRGASADKTYTLVFIPLGSAGDRSQTLGSFTTNDRGNGRLDVQLTESGSAPDRLGTRVGVFVLRRTDSSSSVVDAFVTAA